MQRTHGVYFDSYGSRARMVMRIGGLHGDFSCGYYRSQSKVQDTKTFPCSILIHTLSPCYDPFENFDEQNV
jgi:hypothetical protein